MKNKVMIADDDPSIVEALSLILKGEGYDVITTVDGKTLEAMHDELPDLLLLDIWMSGMDGSEICRKLKANPSTKDIPIIMVSANRDTAKIASNAGANDFLAKPFEMEELLAKVRKYTE